VIWDAAGGLDSVVMLAADTLSAAELANISGVEILALAGQSGQLNQVVLGGSFVTVLGGDAADSVDFANSTTARYASLSGGSDWVTGSANADTIYTGDGADSVIGLAGNNVVFSGSGNDSIVLTTGADSVDAGVGADFIDLGTGDNTVHLGWVTSAADSTGDGSWDFVRFDASDSTGAGGADSLDFVFGFEMGAAGSGDSIAFYATNTGFEVADAATITGGIKVVEFGVVQSSTGGDTVFGSVEAAIAALETPSNIWDVDAGEVFIFRTADATYIAHAVANNDIGSVIKLVGVASTSSAKLVEGSTDGVFYVVPTGG